MGLSKREVLDCLNLSSSEKVNSIYKFVKRFRLLLFFCQSVSMQCFLALPNIMVFSSNCPAGSLSDPENISGLAHFCEHMLFLGTEKYPKENEYSQFLSEHAGSSNAFTSGEHTNYYFDVSHEHLQGALDR